MSLSVLHILSGDLWGGSEAQMKEQLAGLREAGVDARAFLFNEHPVSQRFCDAGIPVDFQSESLGVPGLVRAVARVVTERQVQVVVSHGFKEAAVGFVVSTRLRVPLVCTFHGITESYRGWRGLKSAIYTLLERIIATKFAKRIVAVNETVAAGRGFTHLPTLRVVRNVATIPETAIDSLQHPAIFMAGRLFPVKRYDRALEAHRLLINARQTHGEALPTLFIAGDGPIRSELEAQSATLGLVDHCRFLGFRSDASGLLGAADVVLLSSESEGLPTVILEAMLWGVPVVSTTLPGVEALAKEFPEYPFFFAAHESASLAAALSRALDTPRVPPNSELTDRIRDTFSRQRATREHIALYRELVGQ
ncbi:MAG: glycosyltransferase [Deltaproteobacteria bacterium]|nr:glycosyltransferase [Deltaproteobacteria bacterium]